MPSFACFRWLFWRTQCTLKLLNQVRPISQYLSSVQENLTLLHVIVSNKGGDQPVHPCLCSLLPGKYMSEGLEWETYQPHSALDKLLGQLGIYATWLSSIAYLQKQLRIFIFFYATFFSVITPFLIA